MKACWCWIKEKLTQCWCTCKKTCGC